MLEIIGAVICTIFAGFLGSGILGNLLNWPDAGAICAIATMGAFILHICMNRTKSQSEEDSNSDNQDE
jgi:hypothetical protein